MTLTRQQIAGYRAMVGPISAGREADPRWVVEVSRNDLSALLDIAEAVANAPVVQIGGADGLSCFIAKFGKKSLPSMQGQIASLAVLPLAGEVGK